LLHEFGGIGLFLLAAILFGLGSLTAAWLVHPKKPNPIKMDTYECGLETEGKTWIQFRPQYLIYGLLFVAFDVETVFLFPWAVRFGKLGWFAFAEMIVFISILLMGLWYAWKEGVLEWL
jgi:NADH-quinone oxidoreductase subunit A